MFYQGSFVFRLFIRFLLFFSAGFFCPQLAAESSPPSISASNDWVYTFRPGDTLWKVCNDYCNVSQCWARLAEHNEISKDRAIPPGTKIRIPTQWLIKQPIAVTVIFANGASKRDAQGKLTELEKGDKVYLGEVITTTDAFATLKLGNNAIMTISPNSEVSFDKLSVNDQGLIVNTNIMLHKGKVTNKVKRRQGSQYRIQSPSAVAAVRGTTFSANYTEENQTLVTAVDNGIVNVSSDNGEVNLEEGYANFAKQGEAPGEPIKRLDAPLYLHEDNSEMDTSQQVMWEEVEGALSYTIRLYDQSAPDSVLEQYNLETTALDLASIEPGEYVVESRAIDENNLEGMPAYLNVSLSKAYALPDEMTLSYHKKDKQFKWKFSGADSEVVYFIEISRDFHFKKIVRTQSLPAEHHEFTLPETSGFVRIAAKNQSSVTYSNTVKVAAKNTANVIDWLVLFSWLLIIVGL